MLTDPLGQRVIVAVDLAADLLISPAHGDPHIGDDADTDDKAEQKQNPRPKAFVHSEILFIPSMLAGLFSRAAFRSVSVLNGVQDLTPCGAQKDQAVFYGISGIGGVFLHGERIQRLDQLVGNF